MAGFMKIHLAVEQHSKAIAMSANNRNEKIPPTGGATASIISPLGVRTTSKDDEDMGITLAAPLNSARFIWARSAKQKEDQAQWPPRGHLASFFATKPRQAHFSSRALCPACRRRLIS